MAEHKFSKAYSRYGASMGRPSDLLEGKVKLFQVRLDAGGYDNGGAYWGSGGYCLPLWCAEDENGNQRFLRAIDRSTAKANLLSAFPSLRFYR